MKIFISWSGEQSRLVGEKLAEWLPSMLQFVRVYFSPEAIEKGASWFHSISNELETTSVCIAIINNENKDNKWIHFEAGAISKGIEKSRVCPILFGIKKSELNGPLGTFQLTEFEQSEIRSLVRTINRAAGDRKLDDKVLDKVFSKWWSDLEKEIITVLEETKVDAAKKNKLSQEDILEEMRYMFMRTIKESDRLRVPSRKIDHYLYDLIEYTSELAATIESDSSKQDVISRLEKITLQLKKLSEFSGSRDLHIRASFLNEKISGILPF